MPTTSAAVQAAWDAVERLRKKAASGVPGLDKALDAALGDWHDALCRSVIAAMNTCLKRRKDRAGVVGGCASLVSEARKDLANVAKAFKDTQAGRSITELSRYSDGIREIDVDRGWSDFFQGASCAMPLVPTVEAALGTQWDGYVICGACGTALKADCKERHVRECDKLKAAERCPGGGRFKTMTAAWAVQQVAGRAEPYLRLYTLESPLCYDVNAAMRDVAFCGNRGRYEPMKGFAYSLHRAMMSRPKYEGTVFRAMGFCVKESLYSVGAVVTMPHPTSASEQPDVVKDFLGQAAGGGGVQGTILVLRVRTGRSIAQFSRFPEEKEVLIPANTQFRVVGRPDVGMLRLLEMALDTSLANVVVVELQEVNFDHWGRFADVMTEVEKVRNASLLEIVDTKVKTDPRYELHPVTREGGFVSYPPSTELPVVDGKTLLEVAVSVEHNEQVVSLCCANLAPAAHADALNDALTTALRMNKGGSHDKTAAVLLSKGADVACVPQELHTASVALIACACKRAVLDKAMQTLGDTFWGAYGEEGPRKGWTVLHAAAAGHRADLLKGVLLSNKKIAVDAKDALGRSACSVAAAGGCTGALRALITQGEADGNKADKEGTTPCVRAAQNGHTPALRVLIKDGHADVDKANRDGCTPCSAAAQNGHADALHILIKEGQADVDKAMHSDVTPCYRAAQFGHADALHILITEGGAKVDNANQYGATPCFMAAQNGHADALRILIKEGQADVNKAMHSGVTPCFMAAQAGHTDALRILITEGRDLLVDKANNDGATPCYMAAQNGHADALRILIKEGQADVNKAMANGVTPCFMAAQNGHADALHILITEGQPGQADVNQANSDGATPCYMAALNGHTDALRILITEGRADVNKANNSGATPLSAAQGAGHTGVVHILSAAGSGSGSGMPVETTRKRKQDKQGSGPAVKKPTPTPTPKEVFALREA